MMNPEELIRQLQNSHVQLNAILLSTSGTQDWQLNPSSWSFKEMAAHLAATEKECFLDRVTRIASGSHPEFDYYSNTGRDFSQTELRNSLQVWTFARQALFSFVQALPPEKLAFTGTHAEFGEITIVDVLKIMLDHDLKHLEELQYLITASRQSPLAVRCRQEIIELHQFFQDWFNGDLPPTEDNFARLTKVLHKNFVLIGPDGIAIHQKSLLNTLRRAHNTRRNYNIWIENYHVLHDLDSLLIATYQERQTNLDDRMPVTTTRISTVVFGEKPDTPNGVEWLHLHETWLET